MIWGYSCNFYYFNAELKYLMSKSYNFFVKQKKTYCKFFNILKNYAGDGRIKWKLSIKGNISHLLKTNI